MPLCNRIDPFGCFQAVPERGGLMGNRGILHDDAGTILRSHVHRNWVTCTLSFKDRRRPVMAPGRYTELFFLDEATAFAAGHRPCAECRRARYRAFSALWAEVHGPPPAGVAPREAIDRALHAARIRRGRQVRHRADAAGLPPGTMVAAGEEAVLLWRGRALTWSFAGYRERAGTLPGSVEVLTPAPVVALFRRGLVPDVHPSAGA